MLHRAAGAGAPQLGKLTAQRGDLLPQRPHPLRQLVRRPIQRVRRGSESRLDRLAIPKGGEAGDGIEAADPGRDPGLGGDLHLANRAGAGRVRSAA